MNKEKLTLAVIGGIFGLAILAAGYFVFSAYSARETALTGDEEEGIKGLEEVVSKARTFTGKAIYPCAASVRAIESNATVLVEWKEQALKAASRGDRIFDKTTAAAFKAMVIEDAKRLWRLPGAVDGHIVKKDFAFGLFKDYIAGGKMPEEANLATLQRQWDDVALIVELLSTNGVAEVTAIDLKVEEVKVESDSVKAKAKAKAKAKKKGVKVDAKPVTSHSYVVQFLAKQDVFVRVVNAFSNCERFTVIEDFGFTRSSDAIVQALGGEAKKSAEGEQKSSRRSRRRGNAQKMAESQAKIEETRAAEKKSGIVTDPVLDAPLSVTMKIAVVDFRTLEDEPPVEAMKADATKKEAKK